MSDDPSPPPKAGAARPVPSDAAGYLQALVLREGRMVAGYEAAAYQWIEGLDREAARADRARQEESLAISRSARDTSARAAAAAERDAAAAERAATAAERANRRAWIAVAIAAISAAIAAIAAYPRIVSMFKLIAR